MALVELNFPPGLYANGTRLQASGRWYDGNLIRFHSGTVRPWGGWTSHSTSMVEGSARAMLTWTDNSAANWIGIGTHNHLYAMNRVGALQDITPSRREQARDNPITVTASSTTVTVTDAGHGAKVGDRIRIPEVTVDDVTIEGIYDISAVPDVDTVQFEHSESPTNSAFGGGLGLVLRYLIAPGRPAAEIGGGYGQGPYGELPGPEVSLYGDPIGDPELVQPATVWSIDTFGENLVACHADDGRIYKWDRSSDPATVVSAAPVNCRGLVVTETGHLMALGVDSDGRKVQWCDAQNEDDWSIGLPSEGGDFPLQTGGQLMCGRRTRGGTLLLTDQDAWLAVYNGGANPFSFDQVGVGCGAVSQAAAVAAGTTLVAWMGLDSFWLFNGDVQPLPCEVSDRVFSDLNGVLISHITAYHRRQYGEIVWHYPSANAQENDRYVVWNYREGHWSTGELGRTCGTDRGALPYPLAVDSDGTIWRHEVGFDYGVLTPWVESGPIQIGSGENVFTALDLIPDEKTLGHVAATFYGCFYPTEAESEFGPYVAGNPTNVRFTTRHARMRLSGAEAADWRVGVMKLDIQPGGTR